MNTRRQETTTLLALLALGGVSCDLPPVALEPATATTVAAVDPYATLHPVVAAASSASSRFRLDVALVDQGARSLSAPILIQARRWVEIVRDTDLEDIAWQPGSIACGNRQYDFEESVLDDILVLVSVQDYFAGPTTGVSTWICARRKSSDLPAIGAIFLDIGGVPSYRWNELILHGFGHVLGFGLTWEQQGLLRNSSWDNEGADTHFAGPEAIAAFVAAGGASYTGGKVPVENHWSNGTVDYHWRKSVFGTELMTPWMGRDYPDPISAITIQSLADIGYTVDVEQADAYTLPGANATASAMDAGSAIRINEDVVTSSAVFYDRHGRVVRD